MAPRIRVPVMGGTILGQNVPPDTFCHRMASLVTGTVVPSSGQLMLLYIVSVRCIYGTCTALPTSLDFIICPEMTEISALKFLKIL